MSYKKRLVTLGGYKSNSKTDKSKRDYAGARSHKQAGNRYNQDSQQEKRPPICGGSDNGAC